MSLQEIKSLPPQLIAEMQADLQLEQRRAQLETGYQKNILELEKTRNLYLEQNKTLAAEIAAMESRLKNLQGLNPARAKALNDQGILLSKELEETIQKANLLEAQNEATSNQLGQMDPYDFYRCIFNEYRSGRMT